jgi:hypothetical protein
MDKNPFIMRTYLIMLTLLLAGGTASAQSPTPTCPHPPCAPGNGYTDPNTGQARVVCKNWNHLDCMIVMVNDKLVAAADLQVNDDGTLEVNGDDGRPHKFKFTDYKGKTTKDGEVTFQFSKLQPQ